MTITCGYWGLPGLKGRFLDVEYVGHLSKDITVKPNVPFISFLCFLSVCVNDLLSFLCMSSLLPQEKKVKES